MLVKFGVFVVVYYLLSLLGGALLAPIVWLASWWVLLAASWLAAHQLVTRLLNKHLPPVSSDGKAVLITGEWVDCVSNTASN